MGRNRFKSKGRAESHSFVMYQRRVLSDPKFLALSPRAHKAVNYLAAQYRGNNNGDLCIAWKIARDKGWTSNSSLRMAVKELVAAGFVVLTRQGGRNLTSLYALAWFPIHECGGKLDMAPTPIPPNTWLKIGNLSEPIAVQREPSLVQ